MSAKVASTYATLILRYIEIQFYENARMNLE